MRSESDTEPQPIEIDQVVAGRARLLVHWDVRTVERADETGPRTVYDYAERVIWWTLPRKFTGLDEIRAYLDEVALEILDWAMAAELDIAGPPLNVAPTKEEADARARSLAVAALNARYAPEFEALQSAYMAALILGDEATMAANRQEYQDVLTAYNADLGGIA